MCVVADFAGVIIQTFTPGMMQTNMLDKVKPMKTSMMYKLFCVSPENYARISLNTLGWATIVSGFRTGSFQPSEDFNRIRQWTSKF